MRSLLCLSLLAATATAYAQEEPPITIHAPVRLANMHPDVRRVNIYCYIYDGDDDILTIAFSSGQDLVDGAFDGTLTAIGGNRPTDDPHIASQAESYSCFLQFVIGDLGGVFAPGPVPFASTRWEDQIDYVVERLQHDINNPFRHLIEGTF
jgi:hypothetical protein